MKHLLFIILSIITISFAKAETNPDYSISLIPDELLKNANTVIRYEKKTFTVDHINRSHTHYKGVITILNAKSPSKNIIVFYDEAFEKVAIKYVKIYNANGRLIKKVKSKNVRDVSASDGMSVMNDGRLKYVHAEQAEFPYTIEYEYTESSKMTMFYR